MLINPCGQVNLGLMISLVHLGNGIYMCGCFVLEVLLIVSVLTERNLQYDHFNIFRDEF